MEYKYGSYVKSFVQGSNIDAVEKDRILKCGKIKFTELQNVCKKDGKRTLLQCLADCVPVFATNERRAGWREEKSPEYVALMERLRGEAAEREYRALLADRRRGSAGSTGVAGVAGAGVAGAGQYAFLDDDDDEGADERRGGHGHGHDSARVAQTVKQQLAAVANVAVTVGSVAYAVWRWAARLGGGSAGSLGGNNNGARALLSIGAALVVLVAEVVVFGGYVRRVDAARKVERARPERKAVVETVVIGGRTRKSVGKAVGKRTGTATAQRSKGGADASR